jgi:hypothetical protein
MKNANSSRASGAENPKCIVGAARPDRGAAGGAHRQRHRRSLNEGALAFHTVVRWHP